MKTGHGTDTAATPASLLPETLTIKPIVQAPSKKARGNHGSKKKKKCVTGSWDLIPSELLQEILSRLGAKANTQASVVCKTWFEAAVSVRKFQPLPLPWVFYPSSQDNGDYILFDPSRSQTCKHNCPELKGLEVLSCSRDGWLLVATKNKPSKRVFFFNPFTRERIYLPNRSRFLCCLAFSAAPTSTSCLVISFTQKSSSDTYVISTWSPGETVWTNHRYTDPLSSGRWDKCVFSNGVFYALSDCGEVGVFDPSEATWDVLPVETWDCYSYCQIDFKQVFLMEHDGNIFAMSTRRYTYNQLSVFKLNLERLIWEEKSEVCGLTVFASYIDLVVVSRQRSCCLSAKERNETCPSTNKLVSLYYSLFDEKSSGALTITSTSFSNRIAWVDPPHINVDL